MKPSCRSGTRLYEIWRGMKKRCEVKTSKDYIDYGGRGIKICDDWSRSFTAFMDWAWDNGYSVDRSLDRIDVEKGYCPENCRWASAVEQITNTRETCKVYTSIRLRKDRMDVLLSMLPADAVVTLTFRRECLARKMHDYLEKHQDRDTAIPACDRVDLVRSGHQKIRKTTKNFTD